MSGIDPSKVTKYFKDQKPPNLEELKAKGEHFIDPYFPHTLDTILSRESRRKYFDPVEGAENAYKIEDRDDLEWKRPKEIKEGDWKLFLDKIEFNDINQGALGDCYFLSAISALCTYPELITSKFRTKKENDEGYYEIIFFIDGEWQIVFVDDYIVYNKVQKKPYFVTPNGNELWVMLLEKAWAKVNAGYSNIIGGQTQEGLHALTGFPSEEFFLENMEEDAAFKELEDATQKEYLMNCDTIRDPYECKKVGLAAHHAYTILEAKAFSPEIRLVKVRNPWGEADTSICEWNGDWSDKDTKNWTDELKKFYNFEDKKDGVFWIHIKDFIDFFRSFVICHIHRNATIRTYVYDKPEEMNAPYAFNIQIKERHKFTITAHFKQMRFNRMLKKSVVLHPFFMTLFKYDQERKVQKISAIQGEGSVRLYSHEAEQKLFFERRAQSLDLADVNMVCKLDPGNYILWFYLPHEEVIADDNFKYSLSFSCSYPFEVECVGQDSNFSAFKYLLLENHISEKKEEIEKADGIYECVYEPDSGMGYSVIINKTEDKWPKYKLEVEDLRHYTHYTPPYNKEKNYEIVIPPKKRFICAGVRIAKVLCSEVKIRKLEDNCEKHENCFEEEGVENFLKFEINNENDKSPNLRKY